MPGGKSASYHSEDLIVRLEARYRSIVHMRSGEAIACNVLVAKVRSNRLVPNRGDIKATTPCLDGGPNLCSARQNIEPRSPTVAILGSHTAIDTLPRISTLPRIGFAGSLSSPATVCSSFAPSRTEDMSDVCDASEDMEEPLERGADAVCDRDRGTTWALRLQSHASRRCASSRQGPAVHRANLAGYCCQN